MVRNRRGSGSQRRAKLLPFVGSADAALKAWAPSPDLATDLMGWLHSADVQQSHGDDPDHHAIAVKSSDWSRVAGDDWPPRLGAADDRRHVSRAMLFDIADESRASGLWFPLLSASFAWGYGNIGYGPSRLAKILEVNGRERINKALDGAVAELVTAGAQAGYLSFKDQFRINYLGPAFFTKFLYFAGAKGTFCGVSPLILDAQVASSLRRVAAGIYSQSAEAPDGMASWLWPNSGWGAHRYGEYLHFAHQASAQLHSLNPSWPDRPDLLELALFDSKLRDTGIWDRA